MREFNFYVYIISNQRNTVLYIGVTNNLKRRIGEHKNKVNKSFSSRYNINKLVYFEHFKSITAAIIREKRLKKWKREWKNELINNQNPYWLELYEVIDKIPASAGMTEAINEISNH